MKRNIIIALLSVTLIAVWFRDVDSAAKMRAANRVVRTAGYKVWAEACKHAADGNARRAHWCDLAAGETAVSASAEGVTDTDMQALALEAVLKSAAKK